MSHSQLSHHAVPVSGEEARQRAEAWAQAWNNSDLNTVLTHFHEDATFRSPIAQDIVGRGTLRGKAELREYWQQALQRVGRLHFSIENVIWNAGGNEIVVLYQAEFSGKSRRVCERMRLNPEGLVVDAEAYYGISGATQAENKAGHLFIPEHSIHLAKEFFRRVWNAPHDLSAIDELMTEDYTITTAGQVVKGRKAFAAWVAEFQKKILDASNEHLELFSNTTGDRVVSRWVCRGINNGILGLPATGKPISFTGIAIWRVEDGKLAECWVERSAWELYNLLKQQ